MTKPADRLRKPAPKFGLEEFDPTFDARQGAAALLDECEQMIEALVENCNYGYLRGEGRALLTKLRGEA